MLMKSSTYKKTWNIELSFSTKQQKKWDQNLNPFSLTTILSSMETSNLTFLLLEKKRQKFKKYRGEKTESTNPG